MPPVMRPRLRRVRVSWAQLETAMHRSDGDPAIAAAIRMWRRGMTRATKRTEYLIRTLGR